MFSATTNKIALYHGALRHLAKTTSASWVLPSSDLSNKSSRRWSSVWWSSINVLVTASILCKSRCIPLRSWITWWWICWIWHNSKIIHSRSIRPNSQCLTQLTKLSVSLATLHSLRTLSWSRLSLKRTRRSTLWRSLETKIASCRSSSTSSATLSSLVIAILKSSFTWLWLKHKTFQIRHSLSQESMKIPLSSITASCRTI